MQSSLHYSVYPSENLQNFAWVFESHYKPKQLGKIEQIKPKKTKAHRERQNIGELKIRLSEYIFFKTSVCPVPDRAVCQ